MKKIFQKLILLSALSIPVIPVSAQTWSQIGSDIDGEAAYDASGWSVSMSSDGKTLAIGARDNDGTPNGSGHVRVYVWNSGTSAWVQRGSDIDAEADQDQSGTSVAISSDGSIVAIGAPGNDDNGSLAGHVRVYAWNSGTSAWVQRGSDIDGEAVNDNSGYSVSMSSNGNTVAIGSPNNNLVRVYDWNSGTSAWVKRGSNIDGEASGNYSGHSVSMSSDGNTVAIGAIFNAGTAANAGHVRVYDWNSGTSAWVQRGNDIDGEAAQDRSGWSVSMSANGNTVAIGAVRNAASGIFRAGHVRVYDWNSGTSAWVKRGSDIDGNVSTGQFGGSVSLTSNGNTLIAGAIEGHHARVYEWNSGTSAWVKSGNDIVGEADFDGCGYSVAFSADGTALAVGSIGNDGSAANAGNVRVYSFPPVYTVSITTEPSSKTVQAGNSAQFVVVANNSNATFQWQENTGSGWSNLSNNSTFSGVDNDTLSISSATAGMNGYQYRCIAALNASRDTSNAATLTVNTCPLITTQPVNKRVSACSNALFTLAMSNSGSSFQWQRNSGSGWNNLVSNSLYSGVTDDTLTVNAFALDMNGNNFRCLISTGSCKDTSATVTLNISSRNFTWDGGGTGMSFTKDSNWLENTVPCPAANVIYNNTDIKSCVIGDTLRITDYTTTTGYKGRITMSGKKAALFADDINLKGNVFSADKDAGKIVCDSFSLNDNGYMQPSIAGMDVASRFYLGACLFVARSNSTMNIGSFFQEGGTFKAPSNNGVLTCFGNFTRHRSSSFSAENGLWRFLGDQNSSLDPGLGTNNPVRIEFFNLTIAKTDSNTLTITNNDTIQVNGNFVLSGTNSRVQGGLLNAKGNITMGKSWLDGAFNKVLITGTGNQTVSCDNDAEFSETVVLQKSSGKVLLSKDLSLGSLRFNSGILDPNGKKLTLTGNDISGQNNKSNIKDRAYVLKTDGAFSGNSITVPLSNGDGASLNSISLNTSGTHNDWQLDYVAANPTTIDADLNSDLSSISSSGYWRVQRLTSGTGSAETFLKILAGSGFDHVALLDGGAWRSIGGSVSGNSITSTEGGLFAGTGDWYITAGVASAPTAPNQVADDEDETDVTNPNVILSLSKDDISMNGDYQNALRQAQGDRQGDILVYPNPAQQILHVQLPETATHFSISDLSGRVLASYNVGQQRVNLNGFSAGMYLLSTEINGRKYSVRFVKE